MRIWSVVVLSLIFAIAVVLPSAGQTPAPILSLDGGQVYMSVAVPIQVIGVGLSPSSRIVLNGVEIPTTFMSWSTLTAAWPSGSMAGEYDVMVRDTLNHTIQSNHVSIILRHESRGPICAGGLLSQSAPVQTILDYESRYDTRNCRYLEPPRCYTGLIDRCIK